MTKAEERKKTTNRHLLLHRAIAPAYDMPLERFKTLLAALAKLLEKDVSYGS